MKRFVVRGLSVFAALILSVSCSGKDDKQQDFSFLLFPTEIEVHGEWNDGFANHSIQGYNYVDGRTEGHWNSDFGGGGDPGTIVEFSNSLRTAYIVTGVPSWCGSNDPITGCGPCYNTQKCYNRNVWARYNGEFYYCQTAFNKDSLAAAKADTATADATNPTANNSCGGFSPWSKLTRR